MPITISPLTAGTDSVHIANLKKYWSDAWQNSADANIALVTIRANSDQFGENVNIVCHYYQIGDVTPASIFCIGSVTKVFTGTMLAARILDPQMNQQYALEASVNQWLPGRAKTCDGKISTTTLAELATHSSCMVDRTPGMDHGLYNGGGAPSKEQINEWCNNNNWLPNCNPATKSIYSNWGSLTLAFAVSQPEGYDYDATLAKYITSNDMFGGQAGMPSTSTKTTTHPATVQGYSASGVALNGLAHGIRSSVQDMSTFIATYLFAICQWAYGHDPTPNQHMIQQIVSATQQQPFEGIAMGLDWYKSTLANGASLFAKNGMTGAQGFSAWAAFSPNIAAWPKVNSVCGAGAVVLINKAMKGSALNAKPEVLGKKTIKQLYGIPSDSELDAAPDTDDDIDE